VLVAIVIILLHFLAGTKNRIKTTLGSVGQPPHQFDDALETSYGFQRDPAYYKKPDTSLIDDALI
jgi:hypothetical protein